MIKEEQITGISEIEREEPIKQAKKQVEHKIVERDAKGRHMPSSTANPNGRPPAGKTIVDKFKDSPGIQATWGCKDMCNLLGSMIRAAFWFLLEGCLFL